MVEPILAEGTQVGGRWRIAELLGEGGFGQVFRALDESEISLGQAAVKVLHPNTSPLERKVFTGEVQRMAALRHQNLVGYLDSGQMEVHEEIHSYLVAEYCTGSLEGFVRSQPTGVLGTQDVLDVLEDISGGLAYLHSKHMIHRDIKPANVLYGDGVWKLGDFGLTRDLTATGSYHRGDSLRGTPLFMSPELFTTMTATAPSDVYAVGVLAHLCVSGRPLHEGSGEGLIQRIMSSPPEIDPNLDPAIRDIIYRCSIVDPQQRISAADLNGLVINYRSGAAPPETSGRHPGAAGGHYIADAPTVQRGQHSTQQEGRRGGQQYFPVELGLGPNDATSVYDSGDASQRSQTRPIHSQSRPKKARSLLGVMIALVAVVIVGIVGVAGLMILRQATETSNVATADTSSNDAAGSDSDFNNGIVIDKDGGIVITSPDLAVSGDVDASGHLKGGCDGSVGGLGTLTNDFSEAVDYRIEYEFFNGSGARVDDAIEIVRSLGAGKSSFVNFTPLEEGVESCKVSKITATTSDRTSIEQAATVELSQCVRDDFFEDQYQMSVLLKNPSQSKVDAEVYIAVVDDDGIRVDEDWAGESYYEIAPGGTIQEEAEFFFGDTKLLPTFPTKCEVIAVEFSESS